MKHTLISVAVLVTSLGAAAATPAPVATPVVFICEHGSAKSMIAAYHFNRVAEQRGLPYRAISRGLTPDAELQPATQKGLLDDGADTTALRPSPIDSDTAAAALRIVTIGVEKEPGYLVNPRLLEWDDVPAVSKGYQPSRDHMLRRIDELIADLVAPEK